MKYYLYALIALACIAGSCNKATKTQETVTENFVDVSDSLKITESLKYYFEAKIPVFDSITDKSLLKNIYAPTEINTDDYSRNGLQKALLELKERYFSDVKSGDWDWIENFLEIYDKINMEVFSRKDNFLTTVYTHDGYAGGAHGHFQEIYKMFDLKNNKAVLLENIVKNPEDESWDKILRDRLLAEYKEVEDIISKTSGKRVCFIGDGINDSPVLAISDIGISMGGVGSSSAIEASDIVIMTDNLNKIVEGISISKKTGKVIKQNLIFAISTKILVLLLSTIGFARYVAGNICGCGGDFNYNFKYTKNIKKKIKDLAVIYLYILAIFFLYYYISVSNHV